LLDCGLAEPAAMPDPPSANSSAMQAMTVAGEGTSSLRRLI
jgi:hypothetical protein